MVSGITVIWHKDHYLNDFQKKRMKVGCECGDGTQLCPGYEHCCGLLGCDAESAPSPLRAEGGDDKFLKFSRDISLTDSLCNLSSSFAVSV
jgi:hypothetical protein